MDVSELMRTPVFKTTPGRTLCDAAAEMQEYGIGALAVVGPDDELAGIITERDLIRAMADGRSPQDTRVEWYMSRAAATVGPDADCADAARLMVMLEIRHLPVTRDGRPVGMLSARDLLLVEAWRREAAAVH